MRSLLLLLLLGLGLATATEVISWELLGTTPLVEANGQVSVKLVVTYDAVPTNGTITRLVFLGDPFEFGMFELVQRQVLSATKIMYSGASSPLPNPTHSQCSSLIWQAYLTGGPLKAVTTIIPGPLVQFPLEIGTSAPCDANGTSSTSTTITTTTTSVTTNTVDPEATDDQVAGSPLAGGLAIDFAVAQLGGNWYCRRTRRTRLTHHLAKLLPLTSSRPGRRSTSTWRRPRR
jgi:hypothetical protein